MADTKTKATVDHLQNALTEISAAMLSEDAADPQVQQILSTLQQGVVGVVHAIRQAKSQAMAQQQQGQQGAGGAGQQMSAAPGQQGYGAPPSGGDPNAGAPPGGGGDEMARVLGPSNRGIQ